MTLRCGVVGLPNALEHVREKVRADALTCVDDSDLHLVFRRLDEDTDTAAVGGELDRIRQQSHEDLPQPRRVAADGWRMWNSVECQLDVLAGRLGANDIKRGLCDGDEIDRPHRQPQGAFDNPGRVEEVIDHLRQGRRTVLDGGNGMFCAPGGKQLDASMRVHPMIAFNGVRSS